MPKFTKRELQPPRHLPPDVVDAIIGRPSPSPSRDGASPDVVDAIIGRDEDDSDGGPMRASGNEDSPMRASESAAALRAMGEIENDVQQLDEMERLTRALDPPKRRSSRATSGRS